VRKKRKSRRKDGIMNDEEKTGRAVARKRGSEEERRVKSPKQKNQSCCRKQKTWRFPSSWAYPGVM
jgi:hypothetical protein